jgi:phage tail sheath protein FI
VTRDLRSAGHGVRVCGARTMCSNPQWAYVHVRRLVIYTEDSLDAGTKWAAFEPNDERPWGQLRRTVLHFLTRL